MSLNIFTWNISWECMSGTGDKGSAKILGKKCSDATTGHINGKGPTICLNNVVDIINSLCNIDIIALQESKYWDIIYSKINNNKLKYIHSKYDFVDLVTFYNYTKINIIAIKCGILNTDPKDIRPYHIIFCYDKINNKFIIFINLHNGHSFDKDYLEKKLSDINKIMLINKYSSNLNYKNCQNYLNDNIDEILSFYNKNPYIIAAGDFNDAGYNFFYGLNPFKYISKIHLINSIIINSNNIIPPNTCCDINPLSQNKKSYDIKNYSKYGDYILFSENFKTIVNNQVYTLDNNKLYSDHLPVQTILQYNITYHLIKDTEKILLNIHNQTYQNCVINSSDTLIYPYNNLNSELIFIISESNYYIGYIKKKYLMKTDNPDIYSVKKKRTLRYLNILNYPKHLNNVTINGNTYLYKGKNINEGELVRVNNFPIYNFSNTFYVLVHKENNKNEIGFVPYNKLKIL